MNYNIICKLREAETASGGIAIAVDKQYTILNLDKYIPENLKKIEIQFIKLVHRTFEVAVVNIYSPGKKMCKTDKREILNFLIEF